MCESLLASQPLRALRVLRLQWMLARRLQNWRAVSRAYLTGTMPPPLQLRDGGTLYHGAGDSPVFLFLEIWANRCYTRRLRTPQPTVIVDLGANIGMFAVFCARHFPHAEVHAYEPALRSFAVLQRNVSANGFQQQIRSYNEAVGRRQGVASLWPGDGSITASSYPTRSDESTVPDEVAQVDLATVLRRCGGRADLLKVDVEGAEGDIFDAAPPNALDGVREIVVEYHEQRVPGVRERVMRALAAADFDVAVSRDPRSGPLLHARNRRP